MNTKTQCNAGRWWPACGLMIAVLSSGAVASHSAPPEAAPATPAPTTPTTQNTTAPKGEAVAAPLSADALKGEAALQAKVSFEAKRRPLAEVLAEVQKQSGVTVQAAPDSPAQTARLTARVKDMTLAELMGALSGLYGVEWLRSGDKSYLMRSGPALEAKLLQAGDPGWFRFWQVEGRRPVAPKHLTLEAPVDWLSEITRQVPLEDLMVDAADLKMGDEASSDKGVPVSQLPAELQRKLRRYMETEAGLSLLRERGQTLARLRALDENCTLTIVPGWQGATAAEGTSPPQVRIHAADGQSLTTLVIADNRHISQRWREERERRKKEKAERERAAGGQQGD